MKCATVGCKARPVAVLVWHDYPREPVCAECAESYERRTQNGRAYTVERAPAYVPNVPGEWE